MGNIRSSRVVQVQKVVRIKFVLAFYKLLKNEESFGESFSFPFSAKCFQESLKYFLQIFLNILSCTLPFLNFVKFRRLKS